MSEEIKCPMCGALGDPDCVDREQAFVFGYAVGVVCFEHVMKAQKDLPNLPKVLKMKGEKNDLLTPFVQDMIKAMINKFVTPEMMSRVADDYFKGMLCEEHKKMAEALNEIVEEVRVH